MDFFVKDSGQGNLFPVHWGRCMKAVGWTACDKMNYLPVPDKIYAQLAYWDIYRR